MKCQAYPAMWCRGMVAPLVGAWIEIDVSYLEKCCSESLPLWERGLKLRVETMGFTGLDVAPLVGAWIEILSDRYGPMSRFSTS